MGVQRGLRRVAHGHAGEDQGQDHEERLLWRPRHREGAAGEGRRFGKGRVVPVAAILLGGRRRIGSNRKVLWLWAGRFLEHWQSEGETHFSGAKADQGTPGETSQDNRRGGKGVDASAAAGLLSAQM